MYKFFRYVLIIILIVLANSPLRIGSAQDMPDTLIFVRSLTVASENLYSPAWSFDGKYLAAQSPGKVFIWNSETWENILTVSCVNTSDLVWSPVDYIVAISCLGIEHALEVDHVSEGLTLKILGNPPLAWSSNGSLIAVREDDTTLGVIDAVTGIVFYRYGIPCTSSPYTYEITEIGGCGGYYERFTWSPDGKYVSWGAGDMGGPNIEMHELGVMPNVQRFEGAEDILWLSNGNLFALSTRQGKLQIWDSSTFQMTASVDLSAASLEHFPDGHSVVVCGQNGQVTALDTITLEIQPIQIVAEPETVFNCYDFKWSSNNLVATRGEDETISIWQVQ